MSTTKIDLYQEVTDRIIAALEAGTRPWQRPWTGHGSGLQLRHCGTEYRGINQLLLGMTTGYASPYWLTFKQALELGGHVREGERSTPIIFFKTLSVKDRSTGEDATVPVLRSYKVFNAEQCDGLPDRYRPNTEPLTKREMDARAAAALAALRSCGATIRHGGASAHYSPMTDHVQMPELAAFHSDGGYLATLAHELTHWTGHGSRLDRLKLTPFGSPDYAREELVAEIGAAFLSARLCIDGAHLDNHAAYLDSWLKVLRTDKRAIFRASTQAQVAADLVLANHRPDSPQQENDHHEQQSLGPVQPQVAQAA